MTCYEQIQNIAGSFHLTLPPATIQKTIPESQKEDLDTEQVMLQHMQQLCPTLQDCCGAVGCCILRNICIPMLSSMACGIPCHLAYIFLDHFNSTSSRYCNTLLPYSHLPIRSCLHEMFVFQVSVRPLQDLSWSTAGLVRLAATTSPLVVVSGHPKHVPATCIELCCHPWLMEVQ